MKGFEGNRLHLRLPSQASWRRDSLRTVLYSKGLWKKYVFGHTLSEYPRPPRALSSYPTKRQEESPALRALVRRLRFLRLLALQLRSQGLVVPLFAEAGPVRA